jgi:uncharacterized protein YprB with RNaseH-like and TPR domain
LATRAAAAADLTRALRERQQPDNNLESVLGGQWRQADAFPCFVVETRFGPLHRYGGETIGTQAGRLANTHEAAQLLGGTAVCEPFVFFDLETTGLSGGAGTVAFLVGCGGFDADGAFVTRQYLLVRLGDERALLDSVARELTRAGSLVSFNGKSFDAPLLESRYLYHRLDWVGEHLPHLDMLHVARRFWRDAGMAPPDGARLSEENDEFGECSLCGLERRLLRTHRTSDVLGYEIPSRYFRFLRTGDATPLRRVLEHNRLDLLTLANLTARAIHLVRLGSEQVRHPREALALGRIYARAGFEARARLAYQHAVELSRPAVSSEIRVEALRFLARAMRRSRRYDEAVSCWQQILESPGCAGHVASEANEALAIHHEHRVRDLDSAQTFAWRSLKNGGHPAWNEAVQRRLARIQRKMERKTERLKSEAASFDFTSDLSVEP